MVGSQLRVFNIALFLISTVGISQSRYSSQLKVQLNHGGELIGRHITSHYGRNVRAFLGIPYAKPPVGDLRFRAPQPADAWTGERTATTDSEKCPQWLSLVTAPEFAGSEDCLYLNVYTPEQPKTEKPLPVMVWIHGGGFAIGSGLLSEYNPKYFMDRDVVFVSINYRLGTLGFLSSETLDITGNFGLKDQNMALKWVQKYISAFGGDPENVTILGESAGASSVAYHTFSEKSKGLFNKAIAQSASVFSHWSAPAPKGFASQQAQKLAKVVGCDSNLDSWPKTLDCLRTVPAQNLTEAHSEYLVWNTLPANPFLIVIEPEHEDAFLTHSPQPTEYSNSMPLMIGFGADEGLLYVGANLVSEELFAKFKEDFENFTPVILGYERSSEADQTIIKQKIFDFYIKNGYDRENYQNLTNIVSDSWFIDGIDQHVRSRLSEKHQKAPTYLYQNIHKGYVSLIDFYGGEKVYGTCHFDDVLYMFPYADEIVPSLSPRKIDRALTTTFVDLWYNFAASGNPTPANTYLPKWSPVTGYPPKSMRIGSRREGEALLRFTDEYPTSRMNFWNSLRPYLKDISFNEAQNQLNSSLNLSQVTNKNYLQSSSSVDLRTRIKNILNKISAIFS